MVIGEMSSTQVSTRRDASRYDWALMSQATTLSEIFASPPKRPELVQACATLIDQQVGNKSGLSGLAIKGAYAAVKRIKPQFVSEVIDGLLDEWLTKLNSYYADWKTEANGRGFAAFLSGGHADAAAEDLLSVTDARAQQTKHGTIKKAYQKLRGSAKRHVAEAVPDVGGLIERHARD